jgi:hypothetical protein
MKNTPIRFICSNIVAGIVFLAVIFFLLPSSVKAQWSADPSSPLIICNAANTQSNPAIIHDGSGGSYIFWIDARSGTADAIYGQHLDQGGIAQWDANGKNIVQLTGIPIVTMHAALNNSDKILLAWTQGIYGDTLYAQKLDSDGEFLWNNHAVVAGNNLTGGGGYGGIIDFVMMQKDDGCYFATIPTGFGYNYVDINRIDGSGNVLWGYNGKSIEGYSNSGYPSLISDGAGGGYVAWLNVNFFVQRFNEDSILLWPSKKNITLCTNGTGGTYANLSYFLTVADGESGFVAAWSSANDDVYMSRIDSTGNYVWADTCLAICIESYSQEQVALVKQGNAFYTAWVDSRPGGPFFMQKVNQNGVPQWTANGILVSDQSIYIPAIKLAAADNGSVIFFYHAEGAFYAQKVNSDSTVAWQQPLLVLGSLFQPFYEKYDLISADGGNVIGVAESGYNIYAFSIQDYATGTFEEEIGLDNNNLRVYPNPSSSGVFQIHSLEPNSHMSYMLTDALGRSFTTAEINSLNQTIDISSLPKGIYILKVTEDQRTTQIKIMYE